MLLIETMKRFTKRHLLIFLLSVTYTLSNHILAQPFTPDKYGYVKDPKFHKLIKEKGYELVADFHKVESGNDSLYANAYINGEWKYINVNGELKTDKFNYQKRSEREYLTRDYSGADIDDMAPPMPRIEESEPYSEYQITKPGGKKWGTVHSLTQKQGLPYIYDRVSFFSSTIAIIQKDKKFGLAYCNGEIIVSPKYESIWALFGWVIKPQVLLTVRNNNKYGVIDTTGKIIIPIIYDRLNKLFNYDNGLIAVSLNNKWGLLNSNNKQILPTNYSAINRLVNNVIRVKTATTKKYGLIDSMGNFILDTVQDIIEKKRYRTHIIYRKGNLVGLLTHNGKPFLPQVYDKIEHQDQGFIVVRKAKKYGVVNSKGKVIIPTVYKVVYPNVEKGTIMAMDTLGKWGYIDFENKIVIKLVYDELARFDAAKYFFKRDGQYGIMNTKEKVLKKFKYKTMRKEGDFFVVTENRLKGIVDVEGNILLPIKYHYIRDAHDLYQHGYCKVRINGKYYGVDRYGNEALLRGY